MMDDGKGADYLRAFSCFVSDGPETESSLVPERAVVRCGGAYDGMMVHMMVHVMVHMMV